MQWIQPRLVVLRLLEHPYGLSHLGYKVIGKEKKPVMTKLDDLASPSRKRCFFLLKSPLKFTRLIAAGTTSSEKEVAEKESPGLGQTFKRTHPANLVVVVVNDLAIVLHELAHLLQVRPLDLLEVSGGQGHLLFEVVAGGAVLVHLIFIVLLE